MTLPLKTINFILFGFFEPKDTSKIPQDNIEKAIVADKARKFELLLNDKSQDVHKNIRFNEYEYFEC